MGKSAWRVGAWPLAVTSGTRGGRRSGEWDSLSSSGGGTVDGSADEGGKIALAILEKVRQGRRVKSKGSLCVTIELATFVHAEYKIHLLARSERSVQNTLVVLLGCP